MAALMPMLMVFIVQVLVDMLLAGLVLVSMLMFIFCVATHLYSPALFRWYGLSYWL